MADKEAVKSEFRKDLEISINACSMENGSDTPDFILAEYLEDCLRAYDKTVRAREGWWKENVPSPPESSEVPS